MHQRTSCSPSTSDDSLKDPAFSVTLSQGSITVTRQRHICQRARGLYNDLIVHRRVLSEIYGEDSDTLFNNFADILRYAENDLEANEARGSEPADYLDKLSKFCGQIEKVLRMTRFYNELN